MSVVLLNEMSLRHGEVFTSNLKKTTKFQTTYAKCQSICSIINLLKGLLSSKWQPFCGFYEFCGMQLLIPAWDAFFWHQSAQSICTSWHLINVFYVMCMYSILEQTQCLILNCVCARVFVDDHCVRINWWIELHCIQSGCVRPFKLV